MNKNLFSPLTFILTPFKEKFGVPRQPLLVPEAEGVMEFEKNDFFVEAFRGIENFSHLWLIFSFHQTVDEEVKPLIRPPRFGGKDKWGVFASRSPHRPNHIGLSVVKFKSLEIGKSKVVLKVEGVDLVSGTPILDIKPYIPYCDSIPEASSGPFTDRPLIRAVSWNTESEHVPRDIKVLIEKVIGLDPRPSFSKEDDFGVSVAGFNVRFKEENQVLSILAVTKE